MPSTLPNWTSSRTLLALLRGVSRAASHETIGNGGDRQELHRVAKDLRSLIESTEHDFLSIGAKLNEFAGESREVSGGLEGLVALFSGEHGRQLGLSLQGMSVHCESMRRHAEDTDATLQAVRAQSGIARAACSGIVDTIRTFRVVGTMTRIETARLGRIGADFTFLTEEVEHLTRNIEENVARVMEANATLVPRIDRALERVADLDARELRTLPEVIQGIVPGVRALNERSAAARRSSDRLVNEYQGVTAAIEELVTSLQFQDITRQQVEHVIESLEHLAEDRSLTADAFRTALTLQASQLTAAEATFTESVRRIEASLAEVGKRVRSMASEIGDLFGDPSGEGNSFFLSLERSLKDVLASAAECVEGERTPAITAGDLEQSIVAMQDPVDKIGAIEIQMQRIALNTQIGAAHLGVVGEPLGCLAAAIQEMATGCRRHYSRAAEALTEMRLDSARLAGGNTGVSADSGQVSIFEEVGLAAEQVHSSSEASLRNMEQINARCVRLGEELAEAAEISAGRLFADVAGRCRDALASIGDADRTSGVEAHSAGLHHFSERYTMQTERDVHESLVGSATAAPSPVFVATPSPVFVEEPSGSPAAADKFDLGTNVELF